MKKLFLIVLAGCCVARADFQVATNGVALCEIVRAEDATPVEKRAAEELAQTLHSITGAEFPIVTNASSPSKAVIRVGPGAAGLNPAKFGAEDFETWATDREIVLAGGRPRGTIYAVGRFLQEQCGVRYWTPWATTIPTNSNLSVAYVASSVKPIFEYREPFSYASRMDPLWKVHNQINGNGQYIPADLGGGIEYKGFAHTFYQLVDPAKQFKDHPEWFSMINGARTWTNAQLCLTNPKLRDYTVERVKEWLRSATNAAIISVTQNDWAGYCQCPECKAVDDAEGSPSGNIIYFVNYIAEHIKDEFPNVAVDTFAYQYSRKPPKTARPLPNVIVRLCSIECNFREPIDGRSNKKFLQDIAEWSGICKRLYIWDYVTDFHNYVNPHPNWFVLGDNIRLFQMYNTKGVFELGAYQGYGGEMAEMRDWVLAQLLWNPQLDQNKLIQEFLKGYYGNAAAESIWDYMEMMQSYSKGVYVSCFLTAQRPHLQFEPLSKAELFWQKAEAAATNDPEKLIRVRIGHLPVRYAFLKYWESLRTECLEKKGKWPISDSRKAMAEEFAAVCKGVPNLSWTHVDVFNETGLNLEKFMSQVGSDVPDKAPEKK